MSFEHVVGAALLFSIPVLLAGYFFGHRIGFEEGLNRGLALEPVEEHSSHTEYYKQGLREGYEFGTAATTKGAES